MKARLSPTAAIVNNPPLESGIVKLQRKEALAAAEHAACVDFRRADDDQAPLPRDEKAPTFVQQAFKKRKTERRSAYVDTSFVPPTSNECERFFSVVKLVYSDLRK